MRDETILCISTRNWHSMWRSTQQIISRLAKQNRVLYFEPGRNPDRPQLDEMRRNWTNFREMNAQVVHENLTVIPTPSSLPAVRQRLPRSVLRVTMPGVTKINARILIRHVNRAIEAYDVENPILWLYSPSHYHLVGEFNEKLSCYFVYDEVPDFLHNGRVKELLRQMDSRLSSQVDVVFACAPPLWERRKAVNPNTYLILNGVDFDLFNRALASNGPLPPDIADVPQPIIGFAGMLGYHIDVELLRRVAEAFPDCSLVLIGPDRLPDGADHQRLQTLPNVFFLGQKDRHELPDYLRVFDAALLPYLLLDQVLVAYPLKLHEYLAAGLPAVSVNLPELQRHRDVVRLAGTYDDFLFQVRAALDDHTPQAVEARVALARENTWDQRVTEIYRVLEHHLSAGQGVLTL